MFIRFPRGYYAALPRKCSFRIFLWVPQSCPAFLIIWGRSLESLCICWTKYSNE